MTGVLALPRRNALRHQVLPVMVSRPFPFLPAHGWSLILPDINAALSPFYPSESPCQNVPDDAKIVLMTVDTQDTWLEWVITSWSMGETSHNIKTGKIMGDPINQYVWDELLAIKRQRFSVDGKASKRLADLIESL